jgi:hypothetical protein
VLLHCFIPKIGILSIWGCFLALFGPSRGEKGQKKGKQTNSWQKKLPSKKTYKSWLFCRKKNHGCTIISHRATFVYFWTFFLSPHGTSFIDVVALYSNPPPPQGPAFWVKFSDPRVGPLGEEFKKNFPSTGDFFLLKFFFWY